MPFTTETCQKASAQPGFQVFVITTFVNEFLTVKNGLELEKKKWRWIFKYLSLSRNSNNNSNNNK